MLREILQAKTETTPMSGYPFKKMNKNVLLYFPLFPKSMDIK